MVLFYFIFISLIYSVTADANLRIAFLPWANLTKQFLNTIQPNDGLNITKKYIMNPSSSKDPQAIVNDYWQTYVGYLVLLILGILFIFIFTLFGCCFCCCRCCCKRCGSKAPGPSAGNTKKKRICLNVFLFLFTTMITIGAIVAMASNVILLDALKVPNDTSDKDGNVLANINQTLNYAMSYLDYIVNNGLTNGVSVLKNATQSMLADLNGTITIFTTTFLSQLNFNSILNSTDQLINGYVTLINQAKNLSNISSAHQNTTPTFDNYLGSLVQNITLILNNTACVNYSANCDQVKKLLGSFVIGYNWTLINYTVDIDAVKIVNGFNIDDLKNSKEQVLQSSLNMTAQVNSNLTIYINEFAKLLAPNSYLFQAINSTLDFRPMITGYLNNIQNSIYSTKIINGKTIQDNAIYDIYIYVFYGFVALICIILLIVLLFYVGLCYGVCGGPNFEDSSCCSKGRGSGFLMGGIAISYIVGWLIMFIVMLMFLVGGILQTDVCRYISVGSDPKYIQSVDAVLNETLSKLNVAIPIYSSVTVSLPAINYVDSLLIQCPTSTDIVSAFHISPVYLTTLSGTLHKKFVSPEIEKIVKKVTNYTIPTINIASLLNNTNQINFITNKLKGISSEATLFELNKNITTIPPSALLVEIYTLAQIANSSFPGFSSNLTASVSDLNRTYLAMNSTHSAYLAQKISFNQAVPQVTGPLQIVSDAASSLPSKTNDAKTAAVIAANTSITQKSISLLNQTVYNLLVSLGDCKGLAMTINSAVNILCTTLLVPFNNLWMGMGWFLLFIIPAIVMAVKLHRLYRISHIESNTTSHNKAYQSSNHFLSESDMEMIRMDRPRQI